MMSKTPESVRKMSKRAKLSKKWRSLRRNDDQPSPDLSDDSPQSITQIVPTPLLSRERHLEFPSELNDCALTSDGKLFCVALDNRSSSSQFRTSELSNESVKIYNYSNTSVRSTYSGHAASVQACALSTDGTVASSADYEGHISLWKTNTGRAASSFSAHWGPVCDIDLTPASDLLVSVGADSIVKMWDVNAGACRRQFLGHSYDVYSCAVGTSGKDILSAGADGKLILWDERQKEPRDFVTAHGRKRVSYCAVDRFWRQFVTTGFDSHVRLWDMRLLQPIHSIFVQNSNLYGCDITGSGSRFVACGENGTLQVWSSADLKITESLTGHNPRLRVARCSISDDATRVVSVGHDCAAWLFDLRTPSADEDPLDLANDDKTVQPDCATSALYCNYMNGNERLSPSKVVNALKSDHTRGNTPNLSEIYFGHALVMTIIKSGESFSSDLLGGVAFSETFFYEHLYHKLSQLITTDKEKDFGHLMLFNAKENGLLTAGDIRSIIGDARTLNVMDTKLSHLKNVFAEVCVQVASRLDKLENRVDILKDDLGQLKQDVYEIEEKLDRQAKLHRWASIVKFGLSCIPIAGSFAMGFVDASAELFLSFDLETIVETITGIVGATSQLAVDLKRDNAICKDYASCSNDRNDTEKELKCVQLVRLIMSPNFLDQIPPGDGAVIRATVESHFGDDVPSLSRYTRSVFEDYLDVLKSQNSARSSTSYMPSM